MNSFETLEDEACKDSIDIIHRKFKSNRIKGLYCDNIVALNNNIKTTKEKACILAEELGHHYTSSGNILDLSVVQNRKQKRTARFWLIINKLGL